MVMQGNDRHEQPDSARKAIYRCDIHVHPFLRDKEAYSEPVPEDAKYYNWTFRLMAQSFADYKYTERCINNQYYEAIGEPQRQYKPEHPRQDDNVIVAPGKALSIKNSHLYSRLIKQRLIKLTDVAASSFEVEHLRGEAVQEAYNANPWFTELKKRVEAAKEGEGRTLIEPGTEKTDKSETKNKEELRREVRLAKLHNNFWGEAHHGLTEDELGRAAKLFGEEFSDTILSMHEWLKNNDRYGVVLSPEAFEDLKDIDG